MTGTTANPFDALLADLTALKGEGEALQKSYVPADDKADDKNIAAAADDKGNGDLDDDGKVDATGNPADKKDDKDDEPMGKSFDLTLEDGTQVQAFDATEMLKALGARQDGVETALTKALEITVGTIKTQGDMIKSLQADVTRLANAGRGRKTAVTLVDKVDPASLAKSEPTGMAPEEFMAKALSLQEQGKLSGLDVSRAESYLNRGLEIPADIRTKVMA
jgi:hypothetical protein